MKAKEYDILIVGGGIAGLTAALLLAKQPAFRIGILEAGMNHAGRVSAISIASKCIFQKINIWESIKTKTAYRAMQVWDEKGTGEICFDARTLNQSALGYIIPDHILRESLFLALSSFSEIDFISPVKLISSQKTADQYYLYTDDQRVFSTRLLIGADGAESFVRHQADIQVTRHDYEQAALVSTVQTALPHEHTARQRFLTTGPLAFLPLSNPETCSIVWSLDNSAVEEIMQLDDDLFCKKLTEAFQGKLGNILSASKRVVFPLRRQHANIYVKERIALIGDAAHTIHPLAGQGVNLGILDADCLAAVILDAFDKQRDFAGLARLRKYERIRRVENQLMMTTVEQLKFLFASQSKLLEKCRTVGLNTINQWEGLKRFFITAANGLG